MCLFSPTTMGLESHHDDTGVPPWWHWSVIVVAQIALLPLVRPPLPSRGATTPSGKKKLEAVDKHDKHDKLEKIIRKMWVFPEICIILQSII